MRRRVFQVAEKIREVVASELLHAADPRFALVTITSVVVSSDLRYAKVYWVTSGGESRLEEVTAAFEGASGMLKFRVGKALGIRFVPEMRFYYDDTLDAAAEVDKLLERARGNNTTGE